MAASLRRVSRRRTAGRGAGSASHSTASARTLCQQLSSSNERTSARASSQSASRSSIHGPKTSVSPTSSIACSTRHSRLPAQWAMKPATSVVDSTGSPGSRMSFTVIRANYSGMLPCLRAGRGSRFVIAVRSASISTGRVRRGSITSST